MRIQKRTAEERKQIKARLLQLAENLGNVSEACRRIGCSRDSYYRYKRHLEMGDSGGNGPGSRDASGAAHHSASKIEQAILEQARINPGLGRLMVSKLLYKQGIEISPSGVRLVWLRRNLETSAKRKYWSTAQNFNPGAMEPQVSRSFEPQNLRAPIVDSAAYCGNTTTVSLSDDEITGGGLDLIEHGIMRNSEE